MQSADSLISIIRERGPVTVAAFMDLALYHPQFGYYAREPRRSGRAGDFFTSVDVGPLFGRLLAAQIGQMVEFFHSEADRRPTMDLVEAGAGNGRLAADILQSLQRDNPSVYKRLRLYLVEASESARAAQPSALGEVAARLAWSSRELPASYEGVLIANELLDALPVHQVVMRRGGLREVFVSVRDGILVTEEGPPSTPALSDHLHRLGVTLEPGWRVEIGLSAVEWMREAARRLRRGFMILIDYGHLAHDLYSVTHSTGTLTSFTNHTMAGPEAGAQLSWLSHVGSQDITAHVDFTSVRAAAEAEGLVTLGFMDQTYFLLGILAAFPNLTNPVNPANLPNPVNPVNLVNPVNPLTVRDRFALKTLLLPGGLGSTMKVLVLAKGMGRPDLYGCSGGMRVT